MQRIAIPTHWNVQEAIDVTDFLADIIEAVWETHGDRMAQHLRALSACEQARELERFEAEDDPCDEIPF